MMTYEEAEKVNNLRPMTIRDLRRRIPIISSEKISARKSTYRDVEKVAAVLGGRVPENRRSRPRELRTLQVAMIVIRQLCHKTGEVVK